MQTAAETSRAETLARFGADAKTAIEEIHAAPPSRPTALRKRADDDVAAVRDWSKAEIARIREETDERIAHRKDVLEREIEAHAAVDRGAHRPRPGARRPPSRREMAAFFERLLSRGGPDPLRGDGRDACPSRPPSTRATWRPRAATPVEPGRRTPEPIETHADRGRLDGGATEAPRPPAETPIDPRPHAEAVAGPTTSPSPTSRGRRRPSRRPSRARGEPRTRRPVRHRARRRRRRDDPRVRARPRRPTSPPPRPRPPPSRPSDARRGGDRRRSPTTRSPHASPAASPDATAPPSEARHHPRRRDRPGQRRQHRQLQAQPRPRRRVSSRSAFRPAPTASSSSPSATTPASA